MSGLDDPVKNFSPEAGTLHSPSHLYSTSSYVKIREEKSISTGLPSSSLLILRIMIRMSLVALLEGLPVIESRCHSLVFVFLVDPTGVNSSLVEVFTTIYCSNIGRG